MTCKLFADLERLKVKEAEKKADEKLEFHFKQKKLYLFKIFKKI